MKGWSSRRGLSALLVVAACSAPTEAFSVPPLQPIRIPNTRLWAEDALPNIDDMRATQMKKELETYGVSTKSLLEKADFKEALKKARAEGKRPITDDSETSETDQKSSEETGSSREERFQKALEEAKSMKVKDLKKELQDRGISTASFFEKSEFVKAYADAVADNQTKASSSGKKPGRTDDPRDPSYRDVVTQKFDRRRLQGQSVIDISLR